MRRFLPLFGYRTAQSAVQDGALGVAFLYTRSAPIDPYGGGTLCGSARIDGGAFGFKAAERQTVPVGQAFGSPVSTPLVSKLYVLSRGKL